MGWEGLSGFFRVKVGDQSLTYCKNGDSMGDAFLDLTSVLGAHFHFSYNDYRHMPLSKLVGLYDRFKKHCQAVERQSKRGRR